MRCAIPSWAGLLVLFSICTERLSAEAGPASQPRAFAIWEQEYATGDWGGLRTSLADRGVVFNFTYAADGFWVASGGIKRGTLYNGLLDLGTDVDLEKLAGWKGTHFHVNGLYPHGGNGSATCVGDIGTFSNLEAYDASRLYELWVEQNFFNDRFSLRVGQITLDSEFAVLESYGGLFIQSGFGVPEAMSANLPLPIYPNAALGARLRVELIKGICFQAAVFDGNAAPGVTADPSPNAAPSNEFNRHGTEWALRRDEGALWVGEIGYCINHADVEASPTRTTEDGGRDLSTASISQSRGLKGSYKLGFLYHTDGFADISDTTLTDLASSLAPAKVHDDGANYAIYAVIEQEVWRKPGTGTESLGVFGHAAWMPGNRNFVDFSIEGGLHYQGAIPGRADDALGLGIAYLNISDRVADAVGAANKADGTFHRRPDFEATIELVYRYQASPWLSFQPHVQYVIQPGGTTENDNALILGLRTNLTF